MDLVQPNRLLTSATYLTYFFRQGNAVVFKILLLVSVSGMLPRRNPLEEVPQEKLIFAQLGKEYPIIYGTRNYINMFTRNITGRYSARLIQATFLYSFPCRSILLVLSIYV